MVGRHRASECDMAAHPAEVGGPLRNEEPNRFCVRVDAPRSAAMKRGSELSWATTENPITAGTECSYESPVVVLRGTLRVLERQHPYARPAFINRQKRASLDVLTMRLECLGDDAHRSIGEQVLSSDLHDAWRGSSASSEDCREVEIVGNEDEIVPMRVRQDLGVGGGRSTTVDQWTASNPCCASRPTQLGDRFMSTSSFTAGAAELRLPPPAKRHRTRPRRCPRLQGTGTRGESPRACVLRQRARPPCRP